MEQNFYATSREKENKASPKVIWIDEALESLENKEYAQKLNSFGSFETNLFTNVDQAIVNMKLIKFQQTFIIVSGKLYYPEFVEKFKDNIKDMCFAPKILIFTKNKHDFVMTSRIQNNTFYNFGGVYDRFDDIIEFLRAETQSKLEIKKADNVQLTFEYIDNKQKLILPLFFKTLIESTNKNVDKYTSYLYDEYKENENVENLLNPIRYISDIPMEILSKYYARLYTAQSDFYNNINKELGQNKVDKYLPFIKTLYEGVKLKSLPLSNDKLLYRGGKISYDEIEDIKKYMKDKIQGLPSSIVFSKSFLSFSKDKTVANDFLSHNNDNINLCKVLFVLEKDDNIEYNLSTHADIEKLSFFPGEREVLFFPFSSFEIKDIKETTIIGNERGYEIRLLYLGKYLKDIAKDQNIVKNENKIPDTKFKKQLIEVGLIKKEKVEEVNTKKLYNNFRDYEKHVNQIQKDKNVLIIDNRINNGISGGNFTTTNNDMINRNFIIGEINIRSDDIYKFTRVINSFENFKRETNLSEQEDDWKFNNEKELRENIEIKINGKIMPFFYYYKFPVKGKYNIQYSFKKCLTKTNHMFWGCKSIINLNLSNFNTQNVTNMSHMFGGCNTLQSLTLFNFNTQNVTNMHRMFLCCYLLKNLNLSTFNTQNVTDMGFMFGGCYSLTNLNLSNFNTLKVYDMLGMFDGCNSLSLTANDYKIIAEFNKRKIGKFEIGNSFLNI